MRNSRDYSSPLLGVRLTGVKGDHRVYQNPLTVRFVKSSDFMTAQPFYVESEIIAEITSALTQFPEISTVLFNFTPKPPATVELQ